MGGGNMNGLNKKIGFLTLFIICLNADIFCAFGQFEAGARPKALGYAFVGLADDCWSIYFNPAGLGRVKQNEIAFYYSPQKFNLKEISDAVAAGNYQTSIGNFGAGVRKYGFFLYNEISATLSYATDIYGVYLGGNLNYHTVSIRNYGSDATLGIDAGAIIPLLNKIHYGIVIKNINSPTIGKNREKMPLIIMTGISYVVVHNFILSADYHKEVRYTGSGKFGVEYNLDVVSFRAGISDYPATFSGGLGLKYSFFQIDYAFYNHRELGITHSGTLKIIWGGGGDK